MCQTNRATIALNTPLRLTTREMQDPVAIFQSFCSGFDLEYCRQILWLAFSAALCQDDETLGVTVKRADLLAYYEEIERLIEAAYLLYKVVP